MDIAWCVHEIESRPFNTQRADTFGMTGHNPFSTSIVVALLIFLHTLSVLLLLLLDAAVYTPAGILSFT
jgi:hypothetical protein